MNRLQLVIIVASFGLLEACASTIQAKLQQQSDFLKDKAKLGIAAEAVVPHVHAQTKVNWPAYDKIQLDPVVIADDFSAALSAEQEKDLKQLANAFHDMLA
jgi:hypothetical protein